MENGNDTEQVQEENEEDYQEQLNTKIEKFFETTPYLSSRDELDSFLSAIDLLDLWSTEEEKDTFWDFIYKYNKDSKIDCEGAKKGLNDFLNQGESSSPNLEEWNDDSSNLKAERKESKDLLLTRLSRLSNRAIRSRSGNRLALNRYKQRAIEEYEYLDNNSLIQFKKIFTLLKVKKSDGKINLDDLREICANHKFIKIDINEIWKYLSLLVNEENIQNLENKTELEINSDIMEEVESFISQKFANEDIEYDSDNLDEEETGDKKENLEEIMLDLIEKIIEHENEIDDNRKILSNINREIKNINENEMEYQKEAINKKILEINEYLSKSHEQIQLNMKKLELLKTNILKVNNNIKIMKDDYKNLFEKYNSNQQVDMDEETERLLDENLMLTQIKENKENEIEKLLEEKKEMKKDYQNMLMQYQDSIREKNELTKEISELKIDNYKLKGDYDKLINDVINKIDKDKKNKKNGKFDNDSYENQIKEIKSINNANIDEGEKISRKKDIFNNMANEKLINYIVEIELVNQTLSNERNKREQKILELTQQNVDLNNLMKTIKDKNVDLEEEMKKMQKKIENLNNDVKNNEMFKPSVAMNSLTRISRLSKLNTSGINSQKFNPQKSGNFGNKKVIEKFKLKDRNINQKKLNASAFNKAQNISMDLYGVKEVEDEEEDPENKKKDNLNINKSEMNFNGSKTDDMGFSSNNGIYFDSLEKNNNEMGIGGKKEFNIDSNNKENTDFYNDTSGGVIFDGSIYDVDNNNNFIETNDNISIKNENNKKNNNNMNQTQSNLFFESMPQNNNLDLKKKDSETSEEFLTQKINKLYVDMVKDESNENLKINQIQNENSININNEKKDIQNGSPNNDKDNSSMKQELSAGNSNNINLIGQNKNDKKESEIILEKSNQNEIITINSNDKNEDNQNEINSSGFSMSSKKNSDDFKLDLFSNVNLSESNGNQINYSRLSKAELNQLRNNNYDYYSLFQEESVQRKLKEEKDNCNEFNIYSDLIFFLTEKKHLIKRYIMITPTHIYVIDPKEMIFSHTIKKENILSFQISNKNVNIVMFQIHKGDNILIQTLRRMDLLSYLRDNYRNKNSLIKIKYEDQFEVNIKGKISVILVKDEIFSGLSNFDGAQKIGYLFVYKGKYIVNIFKEKFFILTSIGLIMFDDPSSPPSKLYPIIGSKYVKLEGTKYGRENCFQITLLSGKVKVFATRKQREMESWLNEFKKINDEFDKKMKQLDTINKKLING